MFIRAYVEFENIIVITQVENLITQIFRVRGTYYSSSQI